MLIAYSQKREEKREDEKKKSENIKNKPNDI